MIRINQIKVPYYKQKDEYDILKNKISKMLKISLDDIASFEIVRKSIDAREKPDIYHVYTVDVFVKNESKIKKGVIKGNISTYKKETYPHRNKCKDMTGIKRPIVVGMGPAGLFCGYFLAINGFKPIVIERGKAVEERTKDVELFWNTGKLNTESNVQFGEGGAGTFSDGKLNTMVKDKTGRNHLVLDTFVKFGAPEHIKYVNKPHIGTDVLVDVVKNMRNEIIQAGGEVRFNSKLTDINISEGKVKSIVINDNEELETDNLVLALGHSARDTFALLRDRSFKMEPKAFAVGVRMEHPQEQIDMAMYGMKHEDSIDGILGAADYKLTGQASNGRGVYSFCMCPGGHVVNASSEQEMLVVNGMSYSKRDSKNANSAIIVSVTPDDFGSDDVLAGIEFQRRLEKAAYREGKGKIPVQLFGDFKEGRVSEEYGEITPVTKGTVTFADLNNVLPKEICEALKEGVEAFGKNIKGYNRPDTLMLGVESRTSSPIRICRDETLQSNIKGIYPCGEGAGYAGGITSAAMDGIKVYEAISDALYKEEKE